MTTETPTITPARLAELLRGRVAESSIADLVSIIERFRALEAENARLREALVSVTNTLAYLQGEDWETIKKARAALQPAKEPK